MSANFRIFVAAPIALMPFRTLSSSAQIYLMRSGADLAVLPFDDDLQDRLHDRYGTGDWPDDQGITLSTTDQTFAAECSLKAPVACLQCITDASLVLHSAAVWQHGHLTIRPTTLDIGAAGARRAATLRPINVALRALGIVASPGLDEYATFGLDDTTTNAEIHARAAKLHA